MPGIHVAGEFAYFPDYESLEPRGGLMLPNKFPVSDFAFRLATGFLISTLIVHIIAFFIFLARVYTRAFPVFRFTLDDYIICFAWVRLKKREGVGGHLLTYIGSHEHMFRPLVQNSILGLGWQPPSLPYY